MTAPCEPVATCTGCPSLLSGSRCGYKALRGDEWCLRENPVGTIGLKMGEWWRSEFRYEEGDVRE